MTLNELNAEVAKRGCFLTIYRKHRRAGDVYYYWVQLFDSARNVQVSATDTNLNRCARAVLKEYDKQHGRRGKT